MSLVRLIFSNNVEQHLSPVGLRFVEDPQHGVLVLIPEAGGPKPYALAMTLQEAKEAYEAADARHLTLWAQLNRQGKRFARLLETLEIVEKEEAFEWLDSSEMSTCYQRLAEYHGTIGNLRTDLNTQCDTFLEYVRRNLGKWEALQIHLGLVEGWEHLRAGAAEVKGCLPSLREDLQSALAHVDALYSELGLNAEWNQEGIVTWRDQESPLTELVLLQKDVSLLKEEASLFTLAERVGALEESKKRANARLEGAESRLKRLEGQCQYMPYEPLDFSQLWCAARDGGFSAPSAEKPKSAWRPLLKCDSYGTYFVRRRGGRGVCLQARRSFAGWELDTKASDFSTNGWDLNQYPENYEFCPIPE